MPPTFSFDLFTAPDFEAGQYRVLRAIQLAQHEFRHNRLYPFLGELADFIPACTEVLTQGKQLDFFSSRVVGLDLVGKELVYESVPLQAHDLGLVFRLMEWTLHELEGVANEGKQLYEFVAQNITISSVGLRPMYRVEGYWLVPDARRSQLYVMRYEVSILTSASERFHSIKTRAITVLDQNLVLQPPETIKLGLIETYPDLPNPATYLTEVDVIEFPYQETVLPVAKRKLMAQLYA